MIYEQATLKDYDALLDLANYVFSASHVPHDFKRLIPKEYDAHPEYAEHHLVARDERGIRAMVAVRPGEQIVAGHALRYGYVGTVCAHIYDRGHGFMSHLVPMAVQRAREQGMDYMALGGERARYGRFGFVPGGVRLRFEFLAKNLPDAQDITIDAVEADTVPEDVFALYERQPVHGARPQEQYMTIARTWMSTLYAARRNGTLVAAFVQRHETLTEMLLDDASLAPRVLSAFCAYKNQRGITLYAAPWQSGLAAACADICNGSGIGPAEQFQILRYDTFVRAMLSLKATYTKLAPGSWLLRPEDAPSALRITVDEQNHVSVCETDEPCAPLGHRQAHDLLLGTLSVMYPPEGVPSGWLPLPACLLSIDQF